MILLLTISKCQVIAVIMPNISGIHAIAWTKYVRNVDQIEDSTGCDFLTDLPDNIENVIETYNYELE